MSGGQCGHNEVALASHRLLLVRTAPALTGTHEGGGNGGMRRMGGRTGPINVWTVAAEPRITLNQQVKAIVPVPWQRSDEDSRP